MKPLIKLRLPVLLQSIFLIFGVALFRAAPVRADVRGFQVNMYEPTPSGEWSVLVDHPWYSSMRYFSGGITFEYAHNILTIWNSTQNTYSPPGMINHQFLGHVDLAGSFADRVLLHFSLPILFYEGGRASEVPSYAINPSDGVAVGDPRLGATIRLFGQPYKEPISMHLGADLWFPINSYTNTFAPQVGESGWRFRVKAILGGLSHHVLWSFLVGYQYRPDGFIGDTEDRVSFGNFRSSQFQLGATIAYADLEKGFSIGPELLFHTVLGNDLDTASRTAFKNDSSSIDLLLGINYNIAKQVQLSVGGGLGFLRGVGTPDGRVLLRLSYSPIRTEKKKPADRDLDGIPDSEDLCPDEAGPRSNQGCPIKEPQPSDQDADGVVDAEDQCVKVPMGPNPDPNRKGCPTAERKDRDNDGLFDEEDRCPEKAGPKENQGCPEEPRPLPESKRIRVTSEKIEILQKILFATNRYEIKRVSFPILDDVVAVLKARPTIQLRIEGHTDNKGKPHKNMELSRKRAASVKDYLVQHGIEESRLTSEGFGDTRPVADNKKAIGRDQNRRTEFFIVSQ